MKEGCKKCPFKFENFSFKNVILILLTIQAIWNLFKESGRDMNIEELFIKGLGNSSMLNGLSNISDLSNISGLSNISDLSPMLGNLSPMLGNLSPMLGNLSSEIDIPCPPKNPCSGGSWMLTKVLLIMLFFYLVYFTKTIIEKISVDMELNVNTGNTCLEYPLSGCPLGFGGVNLFEEPKVRVNKKCNLFKNCEEKKTEN